MKKIFVILLLISSVYQLSAQDSYVKKRWTVKMGYQTYSYTNTFDQEYKFNEFAIGADYGIMNFLECGATAYVCHKSFGTTDLSALANVNFHILPLFLDVEKYRLDIYLNSNFGINYTILSFLPNPYKNWIYDAGLGLAFYPLRHLGIYTECNYVKVYYLQNSIRYKIGLVYKFKKNEWK